MSDLSAFFAAAETQTEPVEFAVSKRFAVKGEPVKWLLRPITEHENEDCQKAAMKTAKNKRSVVPEIDMGEYMARLAAACVVYPDLKNAELQKKFGVVGAENLLRKMLLPGEFTTLTQKVQEINGFDVSMAELVDEAKN